MKRAVPVALTLASAWLAVSGETMFSNDREIGRYERSEPVPVKVADEHGDSIDFTGRWVLTLPAGWQRKIEITRASENTYHIQGVAALVSNGVYEVGADQTELTLLEAEKPEHRDYCYRVINPNTLILVRHDAPNGGMYLGATLGRDFEWDSLMDNGAIPRIGLGLGAMLEPPSIAAPTTAPSDDSLPR
jgi:hypothetical protein